MRHGAWHLNNGHLEGRKEPTMEAVSLPWPIKKTGFNNGEKLGLSLRSRK